MLVVLFMMITVCSTVIVHAEFSDDALQQIATVKIETVAPHLLVPQKQQYQEVPAHIVQPAAVQSYSMHNRVNRCINVATVVYAVIKTYQRYQLIGVPSPDIQRSYVQTILYNAYKHGLPNYVQKPVMHTSFYIDVTGIIVQALLYKSVAKMVVACMYCDMADVVEYAALRVKRLLGLLLT